MPVHLALASGDIGSPEERATIMKLQDAVSAAIDTAGVGEFDGDEWRPPRSGSYAIKRRGDAGDPNAEEERVALS